MWQAVRHVAEKKPVIISIGSMAASGGLLPGIVRRSHLRRPLGHRRLHRRGGREVRLQRPLRQARAQYRGFRQGTQCRPLQLEQAVQRPAAKDGDELDAADLRAVHPARHDHPQGQDQGHRRSGPRAASSWLARRSTLAWWTRSGAWKRRSTYAAKGHAGLEAGKYNVRVLPAPKTLADVFSGGGPDAAYPFQPKVEIAPDSILRALAPSARKVLGQRASNPAAPAAEAW